VRVRWVKNAKFNDQKMLFAAKMGSRWLFGDNPYPVCHGANILELSTQDFKGATTAAILVKD
jgi:hypothetical protein